MHLTGTHTIRLSLRTWLFALYLVAMLPMMLFAIYAIWEMDNEQRTDTQKDLLSISETMVNAAGERLNIAFSALNTVATSDAAKNNDLPRLYEHARRVVGSNPMFRSVTLVDAKDQLVFLTNTPYGTKNGTASYVNLVHQVFETGIPNASGPFRSYISPVMVIALSVPVYQDGKVAYCLRLILRADSFNQLLLSHNLPPGWISAIVDRQGTIVARTLDPDKFVGQKEADVFLNAIGRDERTITQGVTLEGVPITSVVRPLPGNDWYLGVAVANELLNAHRRDLILQLALLAANWLALSFLLSQVMARYLSKQLRAVVDAVTRESGISDTKIRVSEFRSIFESFLLAKNREAMVRSDLTMVSQQRDEIKDLYDYAPCGYHSLDKQGRFVRINQTELNWLGYQIDELMGRPFEDLVTEAGKAVFRENFPKFVAHGHVEGLEFEMIRKDGAILPSLINATVIRDKSGNFLMSRATVFDITERKKLEKELDQLARTDALTGLSNRRDFHEHVERELARCQRTQTSLSVLMLDIDHFKPINDRFGHGGGDEVLKALSQSCRTALRKNDIAARWGCEEFAILMPDTTAEAAFDVAERWRRALSDAAVLLADGRTITFTVSIGVSTLVEADANVDDLLKRADLALYEAKEMGRNQVHQASPIRKHLHELVAARTTDLALAKVAAETANVAKSHFLAAASHDLLQPLAALGLYMEVLKIKMSPPDDKLLANMETCVASLSELIPDLLDISKLEAGAVSPEVSDFPVSDLLSRLVAVHAPPAQNKGLRLRWRPSGLHAHTDPLLLERMLGNLIANAIRYTKRGGVLIACRRHQGKAWIEIWDSGIGIPPDKTQEIFTEYRQLAPNHQGLGANANAKGSGLGLFIVAKMAALLGLAIRVESRLGKGSMFAVELPLGAGTEALERRAAATRPLRIALVDDDTNVLHALTSALESNGHQVVSAASGRELLRLLGNDAPNMVISDYRLLDGETGINVIERVRAVFGQTLPALIITADTAPDILRSLLTLGISVQHKPVKMAVLQTFIGGVSERSL